MTPGDAETICWHQALWRLLRRRGHGKAKVAVARKLLVRLFIMLRDNIDYAEFRRRGRSRLSCEVPTARA